MQEKDSRPVRSLVREERSCWRVAFRQAGGLRVWGGEESKRLLWAISDNPRVPGHTIQWEKARVEAEPRTANPEDSMRH